jgi:hypothetical protein
LHRLDSTYNIFPYHLRLCYQSSVLFITTGYEPRQRNSSPEQPHSQRYTSFTVQSVRTLLHSCTLLYYIVHTLQPHSPWTQLRRFQPILSSTTSANTARWNYSMIRTTLIGLIPLPFSSRPTASVLNRPASISRLAGRLGCSPACGLAGLAGLLVQPLGYWST